MSRRDIGGLCSDQNSGGVVKAVKLELDLVGRSMEVKAHNKPVLDNLKQSKTHYRQEPEDSRSSSAVSTGQSGTSVLDQEQSQFNDTSPCLTSPISSAPLCRQFWKAGKYNDEVVPKSNLQNGTNHLHIHPKFLHSNATSHKWAFGAIAELIDNAVDEIQNGATFVIIDKTINPKNGASALLIQDDGGGMDPEAVRRCLSFGFSNKKSKSAIGQYGNGFKTSSMRLGADAIVFSSHINRHMDSSVTQSIGLLSYTFLTETGHNRIVVPLVDYEFNTSTGTRDFLQWQSKENYMHNLSILLEWSPYSTETELIKQFEDVGLHGTKVIIYNLWFNDERNLELDFVSDAEDIRIDAEANRQHRLQEGEKHMSATEQHIANRLRYSLRAYLSVLYMRLPANFCMLLRGRVVEYHNIATDLKFPEFIVYKPHNGRCVEGEFITTIGFLKEAPNVNIYGFNVYYKNRLILPFWRPANLTSSRGRGVVGVLEANFIEPSHNKQDFEKTSVFQKLEVRLKEMTLEYWDHHCGYLGYSVTKKPRALIKSHVTSASSTQHGAIQLVGLSKNFVSADKTRTAAGICMPPVVASSNDLVRTPGQQISDQRNSQEGASLKRRVSDSQEAAKVKRRAGEMDNVIFNASRCLEVESTTNSGELLEDQEPINLMQENRNLYAQCLENKRTEAVLKQKVITHALSNSSTQHGAKQPVMVSKNFSSAGDALNAAGSCIPPVVASSNELARTPGQQICNQINSEEGSSLKKRDSDCQRESEKVKRKAVVRSNVLDSSPCLEIEPTTNTGRLLENQEAINLMQENKRLHEQCHENERKEAVLKEKLITLRTELKEAQSQYARLLAESQWLEMLEVENKLH